MVFYSCGFFKPNVVESTLLSQAAEKEFKPLTSVMAVPIRLLRPGWIISATGKRTPP